MAIHTTKSDSVILEDRTVVRDVEYFTGGDTENTTNFSKLYGGTNGYMHVGSLSGALTLPDGSTTGTPYKVLNIASKNGLTSSNNAIAILDNFQSGEQLELSFYVFVGNHPTSNSAVGITLPNADRIELMFENDSSNFSDFSATPANDANDSHSTAGTTIEDWVGQGTVPAFNGSNVGTVSGWQYKTTGRGGEDQYIQCLSSDASSISRDGNLFGSNFAEENTGITRLYRIIMVNASGSDARLKFRFVSASGSSPIKYIRLYDVRVKVTTASAHGLVSPAGHNLVRIGTDNKYNLPSQFGSNTMQIFNASPNFDVNTGLVAEMSAGGAGINSHAMTEEEVDYLSTGPERIHLGMGVFEAKKDRFSPYQTRAAASNSFYIPLACRLKYNEAPADDDITRHIILPIVNHGLETHPFESGSRSWDSKARPSEVSDSLFTLGPHGSTFDTDATVAGNDGNASSIFIMPCDIYVRKIIFYSQSNINEYPGVEIALSIISTALVSGTDLLSDSFDQALLTSAGGIKAFRIKRRTVDSNSVPSGYSASNGLWTTSGTSNRKNTIDLTGITGPSELKGIHVPTGDGLIVSYNFGSTPVLSNPGEICGFIECTLVDPHLQLGPHGQRN